MWVWVGSVTFPHLMLLAYELRGRDSDRDCVLRGRGQCNMSNRCGSHSLSHSDHGHGHGHGHGIFISATHPEGI
jgi:hypothetical protein